MTNELKIALESAKTKEEAKAVVEKFKDEIKKLTPEELEGVTGGVALFTPTVVDGEVAFATPGPDKYSD